MTESTKSNVEILLEKILEELVRGNDLNQRMAEMFGGLKNK